MPILVSCVDEVKMEPFYQDPATKIYNGDALAVLKTLPDESVQMCMCSPPYWGLRNYAGGEDIIWGGDENCQHIWEDNPVPGEKSGPHGPSSTIGAKKAQDDVRRRAPANTCSLCGAWKGQLGLEPTPELYVEHLMMVFREVKRVLRKDGSFYLNIGDTYASTPAGNKENYRWQHGHKPEKDLDAQRIKFDKTLIAPAKCMICIPERVMFAMIDDEWILRNKNIWHKPNSMPGSQKGRFTSSWEYLYFFVKNNNTILWQNRGTGEWRDTRPTKEENYPWGGMYQHIETAEFSWTKPPENEKDYWVKYQPLWMGFDYYFDLDAIRIPHISTHPSGNKERKIPFTHKGNLGHSIPWQPFNLRVRDVKRGKGGVSAQGGELKASKKEIEEYGYPEKHHGSSMTNQEGLHRERQKHESADLGAQSLARKRHSSYFGEDGQPLVNFAKGKNPGDYWDITTQPSSICVCPKCEAVFPRYTKVCPNCRIEGVIGHFAPYPVALCETPIKASTRVGDVVLDPLAGGGNTGVAAKKLGRKCILIDCVKEYCIMAQYKLSKIEYQPELIANSLLRCQQQVIL